MAYNNLTKKASLEDSLEKQLADQTKAQDTSIDGLKNTDKMLAAVRDNEDLIDTTEVQLDDTRTKVSGDDTVEKRLVASGQHTADESPVTNPLNLLNQGQEAERLKEYKKAETDRDTAFWDKYVGTDTRRLVKKQVQRTGESQLHNHADRFSKLTTDPHQVNKTKVREMVTASLKDADAMLLHLFLTAANEGRELDSDEQELVAGITDAKVRMVMAQGMDPNTVATRIEQLEHALHGMPVTSPDHDKLREELDHLVGVASLMTNFHGQQPPQQPALGTPEGVSGHNPPGQAMTQPFPR